MSVERNKTMTRKWLIEAFNNCDLSLVEECLTEDYINHGTTEVRGYEGGRHVLTQAQTWAPDGEICEAWVIRDRMEIQEQLGILHGISAST